MKHTISLDGDWDFVADLDPKYHAIHGGFHKPTTDRRHWLKVPVPGVWQKYGARYDLFEGVCWFAREFDFPSQSEGSRARLHFGAVNYHATVYLNGQQIGAHEGGYTAFEIDATGALQTGRNHIAVQADNRATTIKWPPCLGYFNYGGIHRGVRLETCAGPALDGITLDAVRAGQGWELAVGGAVYAARAGMRVRVRDDGGISHEEGIDAEGHLDLRVPFGDIPSWSPEAPHLVPVTVELLDEACTVVDSLVFRFGFRTVAMNGGRVHLNGAPLTLKGVCYVYDSPVHGLVMIQEQVETDLRLMKEAGCNAVRCHYPMDEAFYATCDRIGLLVWIEPPVYCYHPGDTETGTRFADPAWLALARQMAGEMIAVARNHPAVAIYSIGNECNTANPEAGAFFSALAGEIRAADPTRLLSYAALYGIVGSIAGIVDVLGINSYWGWYDRIWGGKGLAPEEGGEDSGFGVQGIVKKESIDLAPMRKMLDKVLAGKPELALFLTEFGADAVPGNHSQNHALWSEEYHADLLRAIFELAGDYPQIAGTFPFCFSDYRDPSKVHNGYWNEFNLKGVVDYQRRRKLAFDTLRETYAG